MHKIVQVITAKCTPSPVHGQLVIIIDTKCCAKWLMADANAKYLHFVIFTQKNTVTVTINDDKI